jgi:predicted ATP-dependent serine protease
MTKVGTFAGSAYIKYMIDAMLELKQDEEDEFIKYMIFSEQYLKKQQIFRKFVYQINQ